MFAPPDGNQPPPSPLTLSPPSPRAWCAAMSTCLRCLLHNASEPVREPRPRNPLPPRCAAMWTGEEFWYLLLLHLHVLCWQGTAFDVLLHWGRCACAASSYILRRPTWLVNPTCAIGHSLTPRYFLHCAIQVLTPTCCVASPHCCISYFLLLVPAPQSLLTQPGCTSIVPLEGPYHKAGGICRRL